MKNFEHIQLNDLFLERERLKVIDVGYTELDLDTPEEVLCLLSEINQEIKSRIRGELERKLRVAKMRREALKTQSEKRNDADREIEELEKKLQ